MNAGSGSSPETARTVFASLGDARPFEDYADAEREVGWRVLRSRGSAWESVGGEGGIIETFPEVGLPQVRETYAIGEEGLGVTRLIQSAGDYTPEGDGTLTDATIGKWTGRWYQSSSQVGFIFPTGESIQGQAITARAFVMRSRYTEEEFRSFIASLVFEP